MQVQEEQPDGWHRVNVQCKGVVPGHGGILSCCYPESEHLQIGNTESDLARPGGFWGRQTDRQTDREREGEGERGRETERGRGGVTYFLKNAIGFLHGDQAFRKAKRDTVVHLFLKL